MKEKGFPVNTLVEISNRNYRKAKLVYICTYSFTYIYVCVCVLKKKEKKEEINFPFKENCMALGEGKIRARRRAVGLVVGTATFCDLHLAHQPTCLLFSSFFLREKGERDERIALGGSVLKGFSLSLSVQSIFSLISFVADIYKSSFLPVKDVIPQIDETETLNFSVRGMKTLAVSTVPLSLRLLFYVLCYGRHA